MKEVMLFFHFIGLVMGLGTGFAHAFLGSVASKMTPEEATKFRMHSLVLSNMGNVGLGFLIISGLFLITPYWTTLSAMPLLIAKLVLVATLTIVIVLINLSSKKAKQGNAELEIKKMQQLGKLTMILGLSIVILAVSVFH
jgi:uncharacterized membrane protein